MFFQKSASKKPNDCSKPGMMKLVHPASEPSAGPAMRMTTDNMRKAQYTSSFKKKKKCKCQM